MNKKIERINLRVTENIKNKIEIQAESENRTVSNYIENLILNDLNKIDLKDKRWIDLTKTERIDLFTNIDYIEICECDSSRLILNFNNGYKVNALYKSEVGVETIFINDFEKFYK